MTYIVVYDIEDNRVRGRVAKLLEGFGQRVQESVFECALTPERLDQMVEGLKRELEDPEHGNVRLYRVCADCMRASLGMGRLVRTIASDVCIIV